MRCGETILLEDQDRCLWSAGAIQEGLALMDKAMRHNRPRPYQVQAAIAAIHARATQRCRIRTGPGSRGYTWHWSECSLRR